MTFYVDTLNFDFLSRPRISTPSVGDTISGTYTITWISALDAQNDSVTYSLYYSINNGSTWNLIDYNIQSSFYSWDTYTFSNENQYTLKLEAKNPAGLTTIALLNGIFFIDNSGHWLSNPKLKFPSIGTVASNSIIVQWNPAKDSWSYTLNYTLYFSNNSGLNWYMIAEGIEDSYYIWNISTLPDSDFYSLNVTALSQDGYNSSDASDGYFTIRNTPHVVSQIVLQSPNGGEVLNGTINITWSTSTDSWGHEVTYILKYSKDNGSSWTRIVSDLKVNEYSWSTYLIPEGSNYLIMVIAKCIDGRTSLDVSDTVFTIVKIPHTLSELSVISPNGGEIIEGSITIEWSSISDSFNHEILYSVYYSSDGGTNWILLQENTTSNNFLWNTINTTDGTNNLIKVTAKCSEGLNSTDISDQPFTISNHPTQTTTSSSSSSTSSTSNTNPGLIGNVEIIVLVTVVVAGGAGASIIGYQRIKNKK